MKKKLRIAALALIAFLATSQAFYAQSGGPVDLSWYQLGGAGTTSSGGAVALSSTLGQFAPGPASGGAIALHGGFWQEGGVPTAVEIVRFEAWPERRDIHVQWETADEMDNLGFNLYRSHTRIGPEVKLNVELIPPNVPPGSPFGAVYDWIDPKVRPHRTYFYWLEDLDIYGHTSVHGPVEVMSGP